MTDHNLKELPFEELLKRLRAAQKNLALSQMYHQGAEVVQQNIDLAVDLLVTLQTGMAGLRTGLSVKLTFAIDRVTLDVIRSGAFTEWAPADSAPSRSR
jgi:hypothetical protein